MSGTYAYTGVSKTAVFTATLTLSGLPGWAHTYGAVPYGFAPWVAIGLGGGIAKLAGFGEEIDPGFPPPPVPDDWNLGAKAFAQAGSSTDEEKLFLGTAHWWPPFGTSDPNPWELDFPGDDFVQVTATISSGPWLRYKRREKNDSRLSREGGPSNPCGRVHLDMRYGWTPADDAMLIVECGGAYAAEALGGQGTFTWEFPSASVFIGMAEHGDGFLMPTTIPAGEGARVSVESYNGLYDVDAFLLEYEGSDSVGTVTGDGNELYLETNAVGAPSLPRLEPDPALTRYADVWVNWLLACRDWAQAYPLAKFLIPQAPEGQPLEEVASGLSAVYVYTDATWMSGHDRPQVLRPRLSQVWQESADEWTEPPSDEAELRESGLDAEPSVTYDWGHLLIRREPRTSIQWPDDIAAAPPSEWVADGTGIAASRPGGGKPTLVEVAAGGAGSIVRTFVSEWPWMLSKAAGEGIETVGLPRCYEWRRHLGDDEAAALGTDPSDVTHWHNYGYLVIEYDSDAARTLTLRLVEAVITISDPHTTGDDRVDNFAHGYSVQEHEFTFEVVAGTDQTVYIALGQGQDRMLEHVVSAEIDGFSDEQDFLLKEFALCAYDPVAEAENGGKLDLLASYRRIDQDSELPVDYVGFRGTAEGRVAIVAPDETEDRTGQRGLRVVERLRGAETGVILDHLVALEAIGLMRQEGIVIDGAETDPAPWDTDSSSYRDSFVDADDNDQLGGLYAADIAEQYDKLLSTHAATSTGLAVAAYCGRQWVVSGYETVCVAEPVLRCSIHGILRQQGDGAAGVDMTLWEVEAEGEDPVVVAEQATDNWGRYHFSGLGGFRENRYGRVLRSAAGTPSAESLTGWRQARNRGRARDQQVAPVAGTLGGNLVVMRAGAQAVTREGFVHARPGPIEGWTETFECSADDALLLAVLATDNLQLVDSVLRRSFDLGHGWETGLLGGLPAAVGDWRATAALRDALLGAPELVPLCVQVLDAGGGDWTIGVVGLGEAIELDTLAGDGIEPWPWLGRRADGRWFVGAFVAGYYYEWTAALLDGTSWQGWTPELVGAAARLTACDWWLCRDGLELVAGWHPGSELVRLFTRAGPTLDWLGPFADIAHPQCHPYIIERADGRLELGWRAGGEWTRYLAPAPSGPWSLV